MRTYTGYRTPQGCVVKVHEANGIVRELPLRHDLRHHSQEYESGHAGSGLAQLALALVADVPSDDERAQDVYQRLKFRVVGGWPRSAGR